MPKTILFKDLTGGHNFIIVKDLECCPILYKKYVELPEQKEFKAASNAVDVGTGQHVYVEPLTEVIALL